MLFKVGIGIPAINLHHDAVSIAVYSDRDFQNSSLNFWELMSELQIAETKTYRSFLAHLAGFYIHLGAMPKPDTWLAG